MTGRLGIGDVARRTGVTARTIRYYEEIGLLRADGARESGKRRTYDEVTVERLEEVVRLKELLGVTLDELRELLAAEEARSVLRSEFHATDDPERREAILDEALGHIERQLELVRHRRAELETLEADLLARRRRVQARRREGAAA